VQGRNWRVGVKDPTSFGLSTDYYVESGHSHLFGVSPFVPMMTDYEDSRAGVDIRQSLWRNGFGEATRAGTALQKSASRIELLKRQFEFKNLLLKSENAYWTLVSLNQIVRLQEENVGRAKKLDDWMRKRVSMRLVDDVDGLQARASYEMRDLELQTSLDERAALARQFNMLRGVPNDDVEALAELPDPKAILKGAKDGSQRMTREDFRIIFEQAEAGRQEARAAKSQIAPQLDLVAGVATNGLDEARERSYDELRDLRNPTWNVGVMFSVPLDYSLIGNMRRSYRAASNAAEALRAHAEFAEERTWHDLLSQKTEAQRRFERSLALEKTQTELVKRERNRLLNGRTTTFQAITIEQNLAGAQIQRVRAQVALIQIHNVLKNWEVQK
jgi:outer membrane protein TolC